MSANLIKHTAIVNCFSMAICLFRVRSGVRIAFSIPSVRVLFSRFAVCMENSISDKC
jgi:hypothetical protein